MIIQIADLSKVRTQHKSQKIVLTSGTFDLLHVGHLRYLQSVKAMGVIMVVLLSSDARVKARKGPSRPIIPEVDRAQMLDALKVVDYVCIDPANASPDATDLVHAEIVASLQPDLYATDGPDPRFFGILDAARLCVVPRTDDPVSTSAIITRIQQAG